VDVTANYSSGRGLDYHRFLLEQSQDPTIGNSEMERFYYNETYGVRVSIKPVKSVRLFAARRESERVDRGIKNHTTRFGLSLGSILKSGIYLYGSYNMNRGDASESDSYYISASRRFGRLSFSLSFADYYNGVRLTGVGTPEVFHLPDRRTLSANIFMLLSRSLAFSLDYAYSYQKENKDHQFFVRMIFRK
jgi:outer membrane usher protein FimD/PapC